jgi:hypothetical protein
MKAPVAVATKVSLSYSEVLYDFFNIENSEKAI